MMRALRLACLLPMVLMAFACGPSEEQVQVERWRESGELPFPDLNEGERDRLRDRLDYPSNGS